MNKVKVIIYKEGSEEILFTFSSFDKPMLYSIIQVLGMQDEIILPSGLCVSIFQKQLDLMTNTLKIEVLLVKQIENGEPGQAPPL